METRDIIHEQFSHLEFADITKGINGYPKNTDDELGIYGFDNFKEAEDAINKIEELGYEADICLLHRKAGWHFWQNKGNVYSPLSINDYLADLGENYYAWQEYEEFKTLKERIASSTDINEINQLVENYNYLLEQYNSKEPNEEVISCTTSHCYCEIKPDEMMGYNEDNNTYEIAVVVKNN